MATTTTNLGLIEPAGQDRALVANINSNSEKIDAEAGKARANFALVQNDDTATQAISQGQLVVWKGALKKATANIASGATLSSSNLTDDSIATEIASLNGNLTNQINAVSNRVSGLVSTYINMGANAKIVITRASQHQVFFILFSAASAQMICFIAGNNGVKKLGDYGNASWSSNSEVLTVDVESTYRQGIILSDDPINYTLE